MTWDTHPSRTHTAVVESDCERSSRDAGTYATALLATCTRVPSCAMHRYFLLLQSAKKNAVTMNLYGNGVINGALLTDDLSAGKRA